jgi:hypothetical protein
VFTHQLLKGVAIMKIKFALSVMLLCMATTVAFGQQISVNYNRSQDFSQFHTYAWGSNNANQIRNSILAQGAQQNINSALQSKGLRMVQESKKPDLLVIASGGLRQTTSYQAWGMRGIGFGGGMGTITPQQNVEGTLIVDLYDAKGQSLVWRGIAQNTLSDNGNKNTQMVEKAVNKMFKKYPWPPNN